MTTVLCCREAHHFLSVLCYAVSGSSSISKPGAQRHCCWFPVSELRWVLPPRAPDTQTRQNWHSPPASARSQVSQGSAAARLPCCLPSSATQRHAIARPAGQPLVRTSFRLGQISHSFREVKRRREAGEQQEADLSSAGGAERGPGSLALCSLLAARADGAASQRASPGHVTRPPAGLGERLATALPIREWKRRSRTAR